MRRKVAGSTSGELANTTRTRAGVPLQRGARRQHGVGGAELLGLLEDLAAAAPRARPRPAPPPCRAPPPRRCARRPAARRRPARGPASSARRWGAAPWAAPSACARPCRRQGQRPGADYRPCGIASCCGCNALVVATSCRGSAYPRCGAAQHQCGLSAAGWLLPRLDAGPCTLDARLIQLPHLWLLRAHVHKACARSPGTVALTRLPLFESVFRRFDCASSSRVRAKPDFKPITRTRSAMAAHIGQPARSRRFIKLYLCTWALLAVGRLGLSRHAGLPAAGRVPRRRRPSPAQQRCRRAQGARRGAAAA